MKETHTLTRKRIHTKEELHGCAQSFFHQYTYYVIAVVARGLYNDPHHEIKYKLNIQYPHHIHTNYYFDPFPFS